MNVEPICPGCRIRRRLWSISGADYLFVDSSLMLPKHLPNCPARVTLNLFGIAVETFLELPSVREFKGFDLKDVDACYSGID